MHLYTYVLPYPESPIFFTRSSFPLSPWQPIADFFFTLSIVLSSEKCHILFGIIQYVDFSDCLLSLRNMHLSFLCVFYDLIDHFYCWVLFHCMDIWRASWLLPVFDDYDEVLYMYIRTYTHTCTHTHTYVYIQTLEKTLMLRRIGGRKRRGRQRMRLVGWHHQLSGQEFEQALGDGEGTGKPGMLQSMGSQRAGRDLATEQQHTGTVCVCVYSVPVAKGPLKLELKIRALGELTFEGQWKLLSCPTLCDPMDYTVHGILQARTLEWIAIPFSRGLSQPSDRTRSPT